MVEDAQVQHDVEGAERIEVDLQEAPYDHLDSTAQCLVRDVERDPLSIPLIPEH